MTTDQERLDSEVAATGAALSALEAHDKALDAVIAGLRSQPAAQAMNFAALDELSARVKADVLGVGPVPSSGTEAKAPADSPAVTVAPGETGAVAPGPTPQPAPSAVAVSDPTSTMPAPAVTSVTEHPASTQIKPVDPTPVSVAPVGTPTPVTPPSPSVTPAASDQAAQPAPKAV